MPHRKTLLLLIACAATSLAQSSDPGLGTNPNAQGATSDVTPSWSKRVGSSRVPVFQTAKLTMATARSEDFLNTGVKGEGWTAPFLSWDSLIKIDRPTFYGNVGSSCQQYDWAFQQSGDSHGIDPVFLAFIAMQESSCNADAGGPTPGLMQVACENYPDHQCTNDVAKNVDAGAAFLKQQLNTSGRNAIKTIGNYNGWFIAGDGTGLNNGRGLTQDYPCSADGQAHGQPQNLDYLQQTLNGWFVGLNPQGDENWIGQYQCKGSCSNDQLC